MNDNFCVLTITIDPITYLLRSVIYMEGLTKSVAKSIARHLNRVDDRETIGYKAFSHNSLEYELSDFN